MKRTYKVYITKYSGTARNAGIISAKPEVLRYGQPEPVISVEVWGSARMTDDWAFTAVCKEYADRHPEERRPLTGKSFMRHCR